MSKKLLFIILLFISIGAGAQTTYSPTSTGNTTISKPMGANGFPVDARTYFYDATNFKFRPYVSTTEVKTYLPTAANRTGITVIVNTGGTLLVGIITGGTNAEWWFKDGTADGNLVLKTISPTDTTSLSNRINLKADKTTTVNGHALSANVTVTKSDLSLGNVDNTSDINKPISTATQTALDAKQNTLGFVPAAKTHVDSIVAGLIPLSMLNVLGNSGNDITKTSGGGNSALSIKSYGTPYTVTRLLDLYAVNSSTLEYNHWAWQNATPISGSGNHDYIVSPQARSYTEAGLDDITGGLQPGWFDGTFKLTTLTASKKSKQLFYDPSTNLVSYGDTTGTGGGSGTITLTGAVTGSGTSTIATTLASNTVANANIVNGTINLTTKVNGILPVANGGTGTATPGLVAGANTTITGTWPNQTISSTAGATYIWTDTFDNDLSLSTPINGTNNALTISGTPVDTISVFKNGIKQRSGQDYTFSGATVTFVNNSYLVPPTVAVSRSVSSPIATLTFTNYGATNNMQAGDFVTVAGATPSSLNGTFVIFSKGIQSITYISNDTTAVSSTSTTGVTINRYLKTTDKVSVTYKAGTAQTATNRFAKSNTNNLVGVGSSLVYGTNTYPGVTDFVTVLKTFLPSSTTNVTNTGVPGEATNTINTNLSQEVTPYLSSGYKKNVVIVYETANEILVNGSNSSRAYGRLKTLVQNIKATGSTPYVIVGTLIPISLITDSIRVNFNNLLIANHAFSDGFVDVSANTYFSSGTSYNNTTVYSYDKIHPNSFGYFVIGQLFYPAVCTGFSITAQSLNTLTYYQDNDFVRTNLNYNFNDLHVGSFNNNDTYINAFNVDRIKINKTGGSVDLNSSITTLGKQQSLLRLTGAMGTLGTGETADMLYISPSTFNSTNANLRNYLTIRDSSSHRNVFRVGATETSNSFFRLRADSVNAFYGSVNMGQMDATATATPTKNVITFNSPASSTINGNTNYMGQASTGAFRINGGSSTGMTFTLGNTQYFQINSTYGPESSSYLFDGQGDYNTSSPNGVRFSPFSFGNAAFINRSSTYGGGYGLNYMAGATGFHTFGIGGTEGFGIDVNGNVQIGGAIHTGTNSTANLDVKAGTTGYPTLRLRAGVGQYSAPYSTNESNKYDATHYIFTTTTSITLTAGDVVYISGFSNQTLVPNGLYTIAGSGGLPNRYQVLVPSNATTLADTVGVRIYKAATTPDGSIINDGTSILIPVNSLAVLGARSLFKDNLAAPNNASYTTSALVEMASTTKGFLPTRATTTQINAISSPAEGLHDYDLTLHAPKYYNGTSWITMSNAGIFKPSQVAVTATYSILTTDYYIDCNGLFTVTLPTAVGVAGQTYVITDAGVSAITIATTSGQTISGNSTIVLTAGQSVTVHSDGANWLRN